METSPLVSLAVGFSTFCLCFVSSAQVVKLEFEEFDLGDNDCFDEPAHFVAFYDGPFWGSKLVFFCHCCWICFSSARICFKCRSVPFFQNDSVLLRENNMLTRVFQQRPGHGSENCSFSSPKWSKHCAQGNIFLRQSVVSEWPPVSKQ